MKKSKVLSTPTQISELSFDEFYDNDETNLKAERISAQQKRRFRHEV